MFPGVRKGTIMRTFAQKQHQPQQKSSTNFTKSNRSAPTATHAVHPLLYLQRTIGNQAVQRVLQHLGHDFSQVRARSNKGSLSGIQLAAKLQDAPHTEDVDRITLQADVDAGVPPTKAPAKPPAKAPAAPDCKYEITYANEKNVGCVKDLPRGARIQFDITKVKATGKGCPATLDGLKLTEKVTSDKGCRKEEVQPGPGCTIDADKATPLEGRFEKCTDTYGLCGAEQSFLFKGCAQTLTQEIFIGGVLAETRKIEFEIFRRGNKPSGKATRK